MQMEIIVHFYSVPYTSVTKGDPYDFRTKATLMSSKS